LSNTRMVGARSYFAKMNEKEEILTGWLMINY